MTITQQQIPTWTAVKILFRYFRPYTKQGAAFLLVMGLSSLSPVLTPIFLKIIVDDVLISHNMQLGWLILGLWLATILIQCVSSYYMEYLREWLSTRVGNDIREDVFNHLIRLPLDYYKENKFGDILHRVNNEVDMIKGVFTNEVFRIFQSGILLLGITVMVIWLSAKLFLIVLFMSPLFVFLFLHFKPKNEAQSEGVVNAQSELLNYLTDRLKKISLIKIFHSYEIERKIKRDKGMALLNKRVARARTSATFSGISTFLLLMGPVLIILFGGQRVMAGEMTIGGLLASFQYLTRVFYPLTSIIDSQMDLGSAVVSMRRILELLDTPTEELAHDAQKHAHAPAGVIAFENVSFSHRDKSILQDLSLQLFQGKKYALIGPSGVGKSTLLQLLFRFNNPDSGSIKINGTDIRKYDLEAWRKKIVFVTQDGLLFDGSISDNIFYSVTNNNGDAGGLPDKDRLTSILPILNAELKENINKNSQKVSGGEAQRIALARATMKEADIILLDEATSALDAAAEKEVLDYLFEIWKGKTIILVSHRLSTITFMDKVIYMDEGKVTERGPLEPVANWQDPV